MVKVIGSEILRTGGDDCQGNLEIRQREPGAYCKVAYNSGED